MSHQTTHVETELGRELVDIVAVCESAGMSEEQIHAALLGRIGICASAWGYPSRTHSQSPISSGAEMGERS